MSILGSSPFMLPPAHLPVVLSTWGPADPQDWPCLSRYPLGLGTSYQVSWYNGWQHTKPSVTGRGFGQNSPLVLMPRAVPRPPPLPIHVRFGLEGLTIHGLYYLLYSWLLLSHCGVFTVQDGDLSSSHCTCFLCVSQEPPQPE